MVSTESYKQLNRTFGMPKGDCTDSSESSAKANLAMPGRRFVTETKRKPTANERSLQTKLDSIKSIEFNMYKEVFNDTLNQMTTYREVLEEVKLGYDTRIGSLEDTNASNAATIEELAKAIEEDRRDKVVFQSRLKKLAQENYKLSSNCEQLSEALHNTLGLSAKDSEAQAESSRREIEALATSMNQLEEKLELAKDREKRLMKLLYVLKKRGVPIEEMYEYDEKCRANSGNRSGNLLATMSVPKLDLESADNEESSDYDDSDDDLFDGSDKYDNVYSS